MGRSIKEKGGELKGRDEGRELRDRTDEIENFV